MDEKKGVSPELLAMHSIPSTVSFVNLEVAGPWEMLSEKEKMYAYHIAQASWQGAPICLFQTSPESPGLFRLFQKVFSAQPLDDLCKAAEDNGVSKEDITDILTYVAAFYGNLGNYVSFGDTKFIPLCSATSFKKFLDSSKADPKAWEDLWTKLSSMIYSLDPRLRQLGFDQNGISTYYSLDVKEKEARLIQEYMDEQKISPYNTRLFKIGEEKFEIWQAAVEEKVVLEASKFKGVEITVISGDFAGLMKRVTDHLNEAIKYAENDTQKTMLKQYISSFTGGDVEDHISGSKSWVLDKGPVVESYIGFIESYQDPLGARAEWEGFVAIVDKETSKKFANLVEAAPKLLKLLPWGDDFEKDKFLRPDFTSLEVLAFGSSGVPAGINIPNYDKVRQSYGFKNVSLGNSLRARDKKEHINHIDDDDQKLFQDLQDRSFKVQVGLHELLGHGSGKLFMEDKDNRLNYENVVNPLTGEKVEGFYKQGQTYDTVFTSLGSTFEECRAEAVGIYLCVEEEILKIFGYDKKGEGGDIIYINWLSMARAGLVGLLYYTPETNKWRQAHMQARFVLLRVMLEAGEGLVKIVETTGKDGKPDVCVKLDRSKIETVGVKAVGEFLTKLMVFKSTANVDEAHKMYTDHYCKVDEEFMRYREVVVARKKPRRLMVQAHTHLDQQGKPQLKAYDSSPAGMIQSFVERYALCMKDGTDPVIEKLDESNFKKVMGALL